MATVVYAMDSLDANDDCVIDFSPGEESWIAGAVKHEREMNAQRQQLSSDQDQEMPDSVSVSRTSSASSAVGSQPNVEVVISSEDHALASTNEDQQSSGCDGIEDHCLLNCGAFDIKCRTYQRTVKVNSDAKFKEAAVAQAEQLRAQCIQRQRRHYDWLPEAIEALQVEKIIDAGPWVPCEVDQLEQRLSHLSHADRLRWIEAEGCIQRVGASWHRIIIVLQKAVEPHDQVAFFCKLFGPYDSSAWFDTRATKEYALPNSLAGVYDEDGDKKGAPVVTPLAIVPIPITSPSGEKSCIQVVFWPLLRLWNMNQIRNTQPCDLGYLRRMPCVGDYLRGLIDIAELFVRTDPELEHDHLGYLHLIHGDLKPDQIVYDLEAQRFLLMDFGNSSWWNIDDKTGKRKYGFHSNPQFNDPREEFCVRLPNAFKEVFRSKPRLWSLITEAFKQPTRSETLASLRAINLHSVL